VPRTMVMTQKDRTIIVLASWQFSGRDMQNLQPTRRTFSLLGRASLLPTALSH
jgi:hypothetical protein